MKKIYTLVTACLMSLTLTNCDDFLDYNPTAVIDEDKAFAEPEKMVNAAYAMLGDCWYSYPFNLFPYGDITSDDCLKGGSGTTDTRISSFGNLVDADSYYSGRNGRTVVSSVLCHFPL